MGFPSIHSISGETRHDLGSPRVPNKFVTFLVWIALSVNLHAVHNKHGAYKRTSCPECNQGLVSQSLYFSEIPSWRPGFTELEPRHKILNKLGMEILPAFAGQRPVIPSIVTVNVRHVSLLEATKVALSNTRESSLVCAMVSVMETWLLRRQHGCQPG